MAKSKKQFKAADPYQEITDRMIEIMEGGKIPWVKPWGDKSAFCNFDEAHNAITGRNYSGINALVLGMLSTQYPTGGWLTFKQAKDIGATVRKGEKGVGVIFYKTWEKSEIIGGIEKVQKIPMPKKFTVFNIAQCDNVDESKLTKKLPIDHAEAPKSTALDFAEAAGATVNHGGNQAYYRGGKSDYIKMPMLDQFKDEDAYAATLLHELTHWTKHKSRLDRPNHVTSGDTIYAKEELIAELGSVFLANSLGIKVEMAQHAAYLQSWLQCLKDDKKFIVQAASQAQKAADLLHELAETSQQSEAA